MSDELRLSKHLIDTVQQAVIGEDERAKDPFIASQYLAAVMGYLVASSQIAANEKKDILDELGAFAHHVCQDMNQQQAAPVAPPGSALGVWKPGDS